MSFVFISISCMWRHCLGGRGLESVLCGFDIICFMSQTGCTRVQRDIREFSCWWKPPKGRFCFPKGEVLISFQGIYLAKADLIVYCATSMPVLCSERQRCQLYRPIIFFFLIKYFPFILILIRNEEPTISCSCYSFCFFENEFKSYEVNWFWHLTFNSLSK